MRKNLKTILLCFSLIALLSAKDQNLVSVHAEEANISTILAILAQESGFNIVTGPNVNEQDKLSIHLDYVKVSEAINLVIRASGLSYEIIGNSILVTNQSRIQK